MKKKISFDTNEVYGAIGVLENYLDGALADFENGDINKDDTLLIRHSINALYILQESILGFNPADEYSKRYKEAQKNKTN